MYFLLQYCLVIDVHFLYCSIPVVGEDDWEGECLDQEAVNASYYHTLQLPTEAVLFVDTQQAFTDCLQTITQVTINGFYYTRYTYSPVKFNDR